jgi:hypothetical protein
MGLARYFIMSDSQMWLVTLEGRTMGRYPTRSEAIDAAIVMADLMGAMQHDADVMMEREPGAPLELVWTYGLDRLPQKRVRTISRKGSITTTFRKRVKRIQRGEAAA